MKRKLSTLVILTIVLTVALIAATLNVSAATATPLVQPHSMSENGNYNASGGATPVFLMLTGAGAVNTAATHVTLTEDTLYLGIGCPSWGNNIGAMTLALYSFVTDYETSIEGTPLAVNEFVDYVDNAYLGFSFTREDPLPSGDYILYLSDGVDSSGSGVGLWKHSGTFDNQRYYENDSLVEGSSMRMYVQFVSTPDPTPTPVPEPTPEPTPDTQEKEYLYKSSEPFSTGWWFNPFTSGSSIEIEFTALKDFNGFHYFRYASSTPAPILIELYDEDYELLWESSGYTAASDKAEDISFGKIIAPGTYFLKFTADDIDDPAGVHFVLASALGDESTENVFVSPQGAATNDTTKTHPYIYLLSCDPDPNATPKPTKAPATPTPVPTQVPATQAPTQTPTLTATPNSDDDSSSSGNSTLVIIIIVTAVVVLGAVAVILVFLKKKK